MSEAEVKVCPDGCGRTFTTAEEWHEHAADPHYAAKHDPWVQALIRGGRPS